MKRANVLGAALLVWGIVLATPVAAQVTVGADLGLNSRYMFWGLTLSNRPVVQPDLYLTFAGFTAGVWGNLEVSKDGDANDFTTGGSRAGLTEVDYWLEYNRAAGPTALKLGVIRWTYSQKNIGTLSPYATQANFPQLTDNGPDINSTEIYGAVTLPEVPLSPNLTLYYDADIYKGWFGWVSATQPVPVGKKSLNLGAVMGFTWGETNTTSNQIPLYVSEGITHLDFSAGLPLTVGGLSITPNAHFQINIDDATKFTSASQDNGKTVFTIGTSLAWSKDFGGPPPEEEPPTDAPTKEPVQ
ncbi:MAG: TorF family putative porin [Gemmatimonadales bacterium]